MSPSLQAHATAVRAGAVTATNVIGLRKLINKYEKARRIPAADIDALFDIEEAIYTLRPRVVGDLHKTGLATLRNTKYAKRFDSDQRMIIEADDAYFQLVEFDRIGSRGEYAVPVYRIVSPKWGSFKFRNIPWQSGGNGSELV